MTTRWSLTLSDNCAREIEAAAERTGRSKGEVLRKAVTMYLASLEGRERGLKVALIHPQTNNVETEFVGL
jgi:metal-responsive CopG/Arc/MetJ family transcriptional regulator